MVANDEPKVVDVGRVEVDEDVRKEEDVDAQSKLGTPVRLAACPDKDQAERNLHRCRFVKIIVVWSAWAFC
jgi:hypothetical protein